jgi:CO dehydrogenase maturation factor
MKLMICGKGGCGKSTLAVLISQAFARMGRRVLLVDADESNLGLHRLTGTAPAATLLETLGGREALRPPSADPIAPACRLFYDQPFTIDDLPAACTPAVRGVRLLKVGKIQHFGEGCACPLGGILRPLLGNLQAAGNDRVVVDTAAGVEHFGRGVDGHADAILGIIDPTFESFKLAKKLMALAEGAGTPLAFVLNKADERMRAAIGSFIDPAAFIGELPVYDELFAAGLEGRPLKIAVPEIERLCQRLEDLN